MKNKGLLSIIFLCFAALAISQDDTPKGAYVIVPEESKIEIKTGTGGIFGFAGHGHIIAPSSFNGKLEITPPATASLSVRIDAASLREAAEFDAKDKEKIEAQLHGEVLETAKYPEITFQSTNVTYTLGEGHIYDAKIEGDLTLHGVTKRITIPARITSSGNSLRATGAFKIERPDFKIETKSAGGGTVKVAKTMDVTFVFVLKPA